MDAASGYVILAHQSDEQRNQTLAEWTRETGTKSPRDLAVHLARIRKTGYEKRASYLVKGVINVSYPIFEERASAVGALTVPHIKYNGSAAPISRIIDALRKATAEITTALGGNTPVHRAPGTR